MIPGSFEYHRPSTVSEAVALLGRLDSEARVLAGGHSLIPMMKLRLALPSHLIDLAGVGELKGVRVEGGEIIIGAMTMQHEVIASEALATHAPILREAAQQIADPQVRYLGTIGGNAANGDPGNDMPALLMTLDAAYELHGPAGARRVKARDYYLGIYETAAEPGENLTRDPGSDFPEAARLRLREAQAEGWRLCDRRGCNYLTVANGRVAGLCAIGLTNVADRPLLASAAAEAALGSALDRATLASAAAAAAAIASPPRTDAAPRNIAPKWLAFMTARALARAFARATA